MKIIMISLTLSMLIISFPVMAVVHIGNTYNGGLYVNPYTNPNVNRSNLYNSYDLNNQDNRGSEMRDQMNDRAIQDKDKFNSFYNDDISD